MLISSQRKVAKFVRMCIPSGQIVLTRLFNGPFELHFLHNVCMYIILPHIDGLLLYLNLLGFPICQPGPVICDANGDDSWGTRLLHIQI